MEKEQEITVSVKYVGDGRTGNEPNKESKPNPKPEKVKKQKQISGNCPYCKNPLQTNIGEDKKCPQCGAVVTYAEFKNQHAVIQTTEGGKKKFNFINLLKKWWFWVAIVSVVALIIGIALPDSSKKEEVLYERNQMVTVSDVSVSVLDVSSTNHIDALSSTGFTTTNKYLVLLIKLTNNKSYSYTPTTSDFKVYYNGHAYAYLPTESYWYGKNSGTYEGLYSQSVSSGLSQTVYLVFEVPESPDTAPYVFGFKPYGTEIKIKLY